MGCAFFIGAGSFTCCAHCSLLTDGERALCVLSHGLMVQGAPVLATGAAVLPSEFQAWLTRVALIRCALVPRRVIGQIAACRTHHMLEPALVHCMCGSTALEAAARASDDSATTVALAQAWHLHAAVGFGACARVSFGAMDWSLKRMRAPLWRVHAESSPTPSRLGSCFACTAYGRPQASKRASASPDWPLCVAAQRPPPGPCVVQACYGWAHGPRVMHCCMPAELP